MIFQIWEPSLEKWEFRCAQWQKDAARLDCEHPSLNFLWEYHWPKNAPPASKESEKDFVTTIAECLHNRLEGKPLRDFITGTKTLPELCAGQLLNFETTAFRVGFGCITTL